MRSLHVSSTVRWTVLGLAVVVALMVALWPHTPTTPGAAPGADSVSVATPAELDNRVRAVTDVRRRGRWRP